jgi:molecular chaperone HtpG
MSKTGSISVNTENIFPIIKKFLYSDHEIFLRELVSNATDACTKLKTLSSIGEFKGDTGEFKITVSIDKENKTLTISDNGLGMTEEEIEKYINERYAPQKKEALDFVPSIGGSNQDQSTITFDDDFFTDL